MKYLLAVLTFFIGVIVSSVTFYTLYVTRVEMADLTTSQLVYKTLEKNDKQVMLGILKDTFIPYQVCRAAEITEEVLYLEDPNGSEKQAIEEAFNLLEVRPENRKSYCQNLTSA